MALISISDIQNLDPATPDLFNSRYNLIVDEVNGSLSADNLANDAVTAPKLATDSVTTGKIAANAVTTDKTSKPYKFLVYRNAAYNMPVSGPYIFDAKVYDTGSNFNTTTGLFTAPVAGFYKFDSKIGMSGGTAFGIGMNLHVNASSYISGQVWVTTYTGSGYEESALGNFPLIQLNANDTVGIFTADYVSSVGSTVGTSPIQSWFSGYLDTTL